MTTNTPTSRTIARAMALIAAYWVRFQVRKGDDSMKYYEPEFEPAVQPIDEVYEVDGRGDFVRMEVPDDVADD